MRSTKKIIIISAIFSGFLLFPAATFAGTISLPWSNNLNCSPWTYNGSSENITSSGCTEFTVASDYSACGTYAQAVADANDGNNDSSGVGIRQYVGSATGSSGQTEATNGFYVTLPGSTSVNVRWYERYQSGFAWSTLSHHKDVYMWTADGTQYVIPTPMYSGTNYVVATYSGGVNNNLAGTISNFSNPGDGAWHLYELHATQSGSIQMWVDEKQIISQTVPAFSSGFGQVQFGSNIASANNSSCKAIDYDDLAITAGTYIGPVKGGSTPAPTPTPTPTPTDTTPPVISGGSPSGAQTCSSDPRNIAMSVATDETATCKYDTTDKAYASMANTFSTTNAKSHSSTLNLACGASYTYYVRCQDTSSNADTSSTPISFSINSSGGTTPPVTQSSLTEGFENLNWASRSWYDNTSHGQLETSGCYSGNCLKWAWAKGATIPTNGAAVRKLFSATDQVYLRYYMKVDPNWQGSGLSYQPHMIQILSDKDDAYQGPAYSNLDSYFEINGDPPNPIFGLQDSALVNSSLGTPPLDLTSKTENRSVAGCNGALGDAGTESCYSSGSWYNGRSWRASTSLTKGAWHEIEYYLKMNSISGGVAKADGVLQMWIDGNQAISKSNITYRTNQQADKKWNQLFLGPYMGSGSPIDQTMWIDELAIGTTRSGSSSADTTPPAIPTGLIIK